MFIKNDYSYDYTDGNGYDYSYDYTDENGYAYTHDYTDDYYSDYTHDYTYDYYSDYTYDYAVTLTCLCKRLGGQQMAAPPFGGKTMETYFSYV